MGKDPILFNTYHFYWHNLFTLLHSCGFVKSEISKIHVGFSHHTCTSYVVWYFVSFPFYACNIMSILRPTILTLSFTILSFILSLKHCFFAIICPVCYLLIRTSVLDHLTFLTVTCTFGCLFTYCIVSESCLRAARLLRLTCACDFVQRRAFLRTSVTKATACLLELAALSP